MHFPFPKINSFHNVFKDVNKYLTENHAGKLRHEVTYRGKVKLHGTNAGVVIEPASRAIQRVSAQSRTRTLRVGNDNYGFAEWVARNKIYFDQLKFRSGANDKHIIIFGEWCGPGINNGTAVHKIGKNIFAVFAICSEVYGSTERCYMTEPELINEWLPKHEDIFIIPWQTHAEKVNFISPMDGERFAELCEKDVILVEECDPWVKNTFGVEGIGEGLVYYPQEDWANNRFSDHVFKAKGEKHKSIKTIKIVSISPDHASTIQGFVDAVLTEPRLLQGVAEVCGEVLDKRQIGPFIGWVSRDISKDVDCGEVVLPEDISWKMVSQYITTRAKDWYLEKIGGLV